MSDTSFSKTGRTLSEVGQPVSKAGPLVDGQYKIWVSNGESVCEEYYSPDCTDLFVPVYDGYEHYPRDSGLLFFPNQDTSHYYHTDSGIIIFLSTNKPIQYWLPVIPHQ